MKFEDQCRFKYLLNSASSMPIGGLERPTNRFSSRQACQSSATHAFGPRVGPVGYANKLKSLLLCGSVVLYVRDGMRHKEFYEYGLVSGIHYVSVDTAEDVPAMVRWLRQHDDYARAVAQAGRARMSSLDVGALTDFLAEALTSCARRLAFVHTGLASSCPTPPPPPPPSPDVRGRYAQRQGFKAVKQPGAVRIECEDDLWRHYALSRGWMNLYLMQDNATCVHPPKPGEKLQKPGWGGAYAGSKPRCYASHDLGKAAQPEACNFDKPYSSSESWEPHGKFPVPHPLDKKRERWLDG